MWKSTVSTWFTLHRGESFPVYAGIPVLKVSPGHFSKLPRTVEKIK